MQRIINDQVFTRHATPYAYDVKVFDLGHGQIEAVTYPRYAWEDTGVNLSPLARDDYLAEVLLLPQLLSEEEKLAKLTEHKDRATRRSRTQVRRLAKAKGLTVLLTLTYRENMQDRDRMQRDLDVFLKRVRRVIHGFQYICVFERQKRGAWHAHLACEKVQTHYRAGGRRVRSYDLLRSMWRGVVGAGNGNVDVSKNKKLRSAAKLAAYLSKYIGKTFDQSEKHVNSYSASGRAIPRPMTFRTLSSDLLGGIVAVYDLLALDIARSEVFTLLCDGGGFFMCLSPPDPRH